MKPAMPPGTIGERPKSLDEVAATREVKRVYSEGCDLKHKLVNYPCTVFGQPEMLWRSCLWRRSRCKATVEAGNEGREAFTGNALLCVNRISMVPPRTWELRSTEDMRQAISLGQSSRAQNRCIYEFS